MRSIPVRDVGVKMLQSLPAILKPHEEAINASIAGCLPLLSDPEAPGGSFLGGLPEVPGPIDWPFADGRPPPGLKTVFPKQTKRAITAYSLPSATEPPTAGFSRPEEEAYAEWVETHNEMIFSGQPRHQLCGYADWIQWPAHLEAELVSRGIDCGEAEPVQQAGPDVEAAARGWSLLLQLDGDDSLGWMWGDGGMLYLMTRIEDLARGDFTRGHLCLQCFWTRRCHTRVMDLPLTIV